MLVFYLDSIMFYKVEVMGVEVLIGKVSLRFEGEENSVML